MPTGNSEWQICSQTRDRLGESILWHPAEQALYWIDFYGPLVHRQKGGRGVVESWKIDLGETIGSLVFGDRAAFFSPLITAYTFSIPAPAKLASSPIPKTGK